MMALGIALIVVSTRSARRVGLVALLAVQIGLTACGSLIDRFSGRAQACEIIATGKPAAGTIIRLVDTGTTINKNPVVEFVIRVVPEVGEPYVANARALVSRLDIPAVQPGRVVPVRYDPASPSRIAIDLWECPKP